MKNIDAVNAYLSLRDLNRHKFNDGKISLKVFDLFNKLQPAYDFRVQEEQKIYAEHPSFDSSIQGIRVKDDGSNREEVNTELRQIEKEFMDLSELEFETDTEPFEIDLTKEKISISGEDIGNLIPFIKFVTE